jgi:hypothetical protein
MRIGEVPVVDVRRSLTAQRERLLSLLTSLTDAQWAAPTAATEWSVEDIALPLPATAGPGDPQRGLTFNRRYRVSIQASPTTSTCPLCCARSYGASRASTKLQHQLEP